MKSILLLPVAALVACASLSHDARHETLLEANRQYDIALVAGDAAMLDRLYLEDFVYIGGANVEKRNKKQQITAMTDGSVKLLEGKSENIEAKHFGDLAVVTGEFIGRVRIKNKEISFRELYSTVWRHHSGRWRLELEHGSMVPDKP